MRTMNNYNQVTFCSSLNYCELAIESKENLYVARFWKNGDRELAHNCRIVPMFPKSPLVSVLRDAISKHEIDIAAYMACKDTNEGRAIYWKIQDNLQGRGSNEAFAL